MTTRERGDYDYNKAIDPGGRNRGLSGAHHPWFACWRSPSVVRVLADAFGPQSGSRAALFAGLRLPKAAVHAALLDILDLVLQEQSMEGMLILAAADMELRRALACLPPAPMVH